MTRLSRRKPTRAFKNGGSRPQQEPESQTRWAISYADFMTLLLAFFLVSYFALARNTTATPQTASITQQARKSRQIELGDLDQKIEEWVHAMKLDSMVSIQDLPRGEVVSFNEDLLFPSGQATLTSSARRTLSQLGELIRTTPFHVRVEGYTDDVPISSQEFPSNWHLSAARATTVLYYLIRHEHISPDTISEASYGETRPRVPNDTPEHRAENRRVDIVFLAPAADPVAGTAGSGSI